MWFWSVSLAYQLSGQFLIFLVDQIFSWYTKKKAVPWRNGEEVGLVYQRSAVRAPPQEIFHFNSGIAVLQNAWISALDYSKYIIIIIYILLLLLVLKLPKIIKRCLDKNCSNLLLYIFNFLLLELELQAWKVQKDETNSCLLKLTSSEK